MAEVVEKIEEELEEVKGAISEGNPVHLRKNLGICCLQ